MTVKKADQIEYVVLVDQQNHEIGLAEKLAAHQANQLHRAFSVFIFQADREKPTLLLQQRQAHKYHSANLWTNTCCSHPRKNEAVTAAGARRLQEEMGIIASLKDLGWFHYQAQFANGLAENEIDHVLVGTIPATTVITPNPQEVQAYRWVELADLKQELAAHPEQFTPWLAKALAIVSQHIPEIFDTKPQPLL